MPVQDNIEVSVMVNGKPLQEYPDENLTENDLHCRTRYIEVSQSDTFEIQVTFLPGFRTMGASFVKSRICLDDTNKGWSIAKSVRQAHKNKGALTNGTEIVFKSIPCQNLETGRWEDCPFQFASLSTPDNGSAREQLSSDSISTAGRIYVTCFRARRFVNQVPFSGDGSRPATNYKLPEFIPDGKEIKSKIIIPNGIPRDPPSRIIDSYDPIKGQHGTRYEFVFIYRHKEILKKLNIIPSSPVQIPAQPNHDQQLEGLSSLLELEKKKNSLMMKQFKELQDRIHHLESAATESSGSGQRSINSYFSTDERTSRDKDKRKRIEQGDDDGDDLEEVQPPPPQKPKLVIDISDDDDDNE